MSGQTPGDVREDWFAVLAFAAHTDRPNASEAFAAWQHLSERKRVNWRATVDAVRMAIAQADAAPAEQKPAPELAAAMAETRGYRERLDAIRKLCEARLRVVGMVDGKGVARKVIAIIDKPEAGQ